MDGIKLSIFEEKDQNHGKEKILIFYILVQWKKQPVNTLPWDNNNWVWNPCFADMKISAVLKVTTYLDSWNLCESHSLTLLLQLNLLEKHQEPLGN